MLCMHAPLVLPAAFGHDRSDRRIAVLRQIGATGSISQAARVVGISYKAAWQAVDTLTTLAGAPLVERAVGGAGGGGAVLTPAAHELLGAADAILQARGAVLAQWQGAVGTLPIGAALARMAVRTSMRNQLPCVVQELDLQGGLARVVMSIDAAQDAKTALGPNASGAGTQAQLSARITRESAELLGLAPGVPVLAMCKATAVRVTRAGQDAQESTAGSVALAAKATRVVRGSLGDEVAAQLWCADRPMALQMVGFATPGSGLRAGSRLALRMEENAVVLALAND